MRYDSEALRRIRTRRKLGREEVAKKAGISAQNLSYIERGLTQPRVDTLAKLATVLRVSPAQFFTKVVA